MSRHDTQYPVSVKIIIGWITGWLEPLPLARCPYANMGTSGKFVIQRRQGIQRGQIPSGGLPAPLLRPANSVTAAARPSAGQGSALRPGRTHFVTRIRAGPPEDVDVPDRPVSQWVYRRVILEPVRRDESEGEGGK